MEFSTFCHEKLLQCQFYLYLSKMNSMLILETWKSYFFCINKGVDSDTWWNTCFTKLFISYLFPFEINQLVFHGEQTSSFHKIVYQHPILYPALISGSTCWYNICTIYYVYIFIYKVNQGYPYKAKMYSLQKTQDFWVFWKKLLNLLWKV